MTISDAFPGRIQILHVRSSHLSAVGAAGHADWLVAPVESLPVDDERGLLGGRRLRGAPLHSPEVHHRDVARQVLVHGLVGPARGCVDSEIRNCEQFISLLI